MNKKEAIKAVEQDKIQVGRFTEITREVNAIQRKIEMVDYVPLETVINIFDKISETEKVTIPKFVAEWIVETEKIHNNLSWVWFSNPVSDELNAWLKNHTETFMRAWLDGYEVVQEKLYTVEIPDPNSYYDYRFLSRDDNGIYLDASKGTKWKQKERNQLTEAEIKQDFEWAWDAGFAKEVEAENDID